MKLKLLLLLLVLVAVSHCCRAQQITGTVREETGNPLNGATVTLVKAGDSSIVKLALTKADGSFSFSGMREGTYRVLLSHVGYKPAFSEAIAMGSSDVSVPEIKLTKLAANLSAITVSAKKPLVEVKADRMVLNVEGTINATGSNALELLRRSPGVVMDKDENISLAGKNGVQVYVDGRSTPLSGQELAHYLKTLQSSQVEAIELITNPSAKYDAAGNAGIINIRLLKNKSLGANGSVNAGWNIATYPKLNAGFSLNYRNQKINIFSTYSFSNNINDQHLDVNRTVIDSQFAQKGSILDKRQSHNFKAGADYFINKKSTFGVMVNGIMAEPTSNSNNRTEISQVGAPVDRILVADNTTNMKRHNANLNLNYSYTGANGSSMVINADRGFYHLNSDQLQRNFYYDAAGQVKLNEVIYHMVSPAEIGISSIKADYEQNFLKGKLGFGAKAAFVETDNDFRRSNVDGSTETTDRERSSHFNYKEKIKAGYVNYNRQYKSLMLQAGLRIENTEAEGISNGLKLSGTGYVNSIAAFNRSYTDFFPSAAVTFNKNPKKIWSLTYSRRIDRPAYQDLNPFEFKLDEYTFMKGNVNLRPQYTNSFGIMHTYMYKMNFSLNYSHVSDLFTMIMDTVEQSKAFASKKNLATQDIASFTVSLPYQYKSYSVFASISTNYSRYRADFGPGRQVNLEAMGFNLFLQNSVKLCKVVTAEVSGFYNAPTVQGSFRSKSAYNVDAGLSAQVMQGKATVKAAVSDVFHTMSFRASSDFAGQSMKVRFGQESRQLKLSFNYRFGKSTVKPARQRTSGAEEESKRVQQGGGLLGG